MIDDNDVNKFGYEEMILIWIRKQNDHNLINRLNLNMTPATIVQSSKKKTGKIVEATSLLPIQLTKA